ncbi:MAG TPA: hypothetical protein PK331_06675 [Gordonia sp. (in: high G+C Gram-positive bacteria)]|uniref:hypothetical protein n=1 Tax=unclassified Gordonia (in: high G+C Gram-positive bacteria) TaxID=2657482 RepID=UPI0025C2FFD6|nr:MULTISPECIES: hypothetical protein [unclassified Gordonia (in: high G+C Gram-positive bacteria)]HNP56150.1 hypothetical protein [Gordonia sp. (in: high G+C Gram-positive bacteria)]HRC50593.1 hypothetical protein [Gordonia sp. (in: high G+C Gram-positive bacteria)]
MTVSPDPVDTLRRWSDSGAVWRVLSRRGGTLVIGLYRCDGGEEVDRLASADPQLIEFVGARNSNED